MRKVDGLVIVLLGSACLLSACGGGSSSSGGAVASVPVAPAPVVDPSPPYDSFVNPVAKLFKSQIVEVSSTTHADSYTINRNSSGRSVGYDNGGMTIDYRPDEGVYTVSDGNYSTNFTQADKAVDGTPSHPVNYTRYWKEVPSSIVNRDAYDALYLYDKTNQKLSYANIAVWARTRTGTVTPDPSSGFTNIGRFTYGIIGYETLASDMPRTGVAFYSVTATGVHAQDGDRDLPTSDPNYGYSGIIQPAVSLQADFAAGTVTTRIHLNRYARPNPQLDGKGTIGAGTSRFAGVLTSSDPDLKGSFEGGFYGPKAAEIGFTFIATDSRGVTVGAAAGKK